MEQSPPSEANRFSDSQEISHILWNPKFHYRVYKMPVTWSYPGPDQSSPCPPITISEVPP
jgi:hypothetical protein